MEKVSFNRFKEAVFLNFQRFTGENAVLYRTDTDPDMLWEIYLNSFPAGTNELFRKRTEHDCSACRHFIKSAGNIVAIKDNELESIWDVFLPFTQYEPVAKALADYVKSCPIKDVFVSCESRIGISREWTVDGEFEHFYIEVPHKFIKAKNTIPTYLNEVRTSKQVFQRALEEISLDSIDTVLELIVSNSLYRGNEWRTALGTLRFHVVAYGKLPEDKKDLYAWAISPMIPPNVSRIKNHSIGVLLADISSGVELDEAVSRYEAIVAPANYKRPKAIFTKRMLEDAQDKVRELGLMDSLPRRFATLDDISVNNILFSNKDAAKRISGSVFDDMAADIPVNPKKFSKTETMTAGDFVKNILPTAKSLELLFEGRHAKNLVSLTAPVNRDAKSMFKWDNPFGWAYTGNIADSDIRRNVKSAGGKVDGVLRFSIQWNDGEEVDNNDVDAHCIEPGGNHIFFGKRTNPLTGGNLDVDIIDPKCGVPAVENITWPDIKKMRRGIYRFFVHCFSSRGGRSGFKAEVEFDGQIYRFDYPHALRQGQEVVVADVMFDGERFTIGPKLESEAFSSEHWGIKTNQFIPVSVVCYSPNYWNEQKGIGNQHYFFMLKDCINPERPNGIFNEYLTNELLVHKRVFEALGAKMRLEDSADQLSGVGFCTTRRDSVTVKVKGATERLIKIEF